MRLRYILPFAAVLALASCNDQTARKAADASRTPLPATAAGPACPPTPACIPAKTAGAKAGAARKAAVHKTSHRKASPASGRKVAANSHRHYRTYRDDGLAGGPPARHYRRWDGRSPEPGYAYRRYGEGGYRYGALPPRDWSDDGRRHDDRRAYEDRRTYEDRGRETYERDDDGAPGAGGWASPPKGSGYYYRHGGAERGPDRYSPGYSSRPQEGPSVAERYSSRESDGSHRRGGDVRGGQVYDYDALRNDERATSGYREGHSYRDGRWMRAERRDSETSTSSYEERSSSGGTGPCCVSGSSVGAAGFDRNGYLTWPGKVPARP